MQPQNHPSLRVPPNGLFLSACVLAFTASTASAQFGDPVQKFVDPDLGPTQETAIFSAPHSDATPPLVQDVDTFTTGVDESIGTTFMANLNPAQGAFVTSGGSIYSFATDFDFTLNLGFDTGAVTDITNVTFQLRSLGDPTDGGGVLPTLSYNGGAQNLAADFNTDLFLQNALFFVPAEGEFQNVTITEYLLQWDLSAIGDDIESITFNWTQPESIGVRDVRIDVSEAAFVEVVPEPSTYAALLATTALALTLLRRRFRKAAHPSA